ncbi:EamA family transporter [Kocuria palustris]|uniref:EamA family transporter n=1 Tax=Kocuria palustris TaxID=71999 RepID=UPI003D72F0BC
MSETSTDATAIPAKGGRTLSRQTKGTVLVALAVLWQGVGTAVVGATVPPELSTFTTFAAFLTAAALAGAAFTWRRRGTSAVVRKTPRLPLRDVVVINLLTAGAFSAFYVAATLIPPTAASVIETGLGPVAVSVALMFSGAAGRARFAHPLVVLGVSAGVAYLVMSLAGSHTDATAVGIALSVLAGCCAAGVLLNSSRLSGRGVTALHISAVRFHLAWVLSGLIALPIVTRLLPDHPGELVSAAVVGVFCIVAPILLLQWGITIAHPVHSALVISTLPAVVLIGDLILGAPAHPALLVGMAVLVAISLMGVLRRT